MHPSKVYAREQRAAEREVAALRAMPGVTVYDTAEEARKAAEPRFITRWIDPAIIEANPWPPKRRK